MAVDKLFGEAPETVDELMGRARERIAAAEEANGSGLYDEAKRHWTLAESYLDRARRLNAEAVFEAERVAA